VCECVCARVCVKFGITNRNILKQSSYSKQAIRYPIHVVLRLSSPPCTAWSYPLRRPHDHTDTTQDLTKPLLSHHLVFCLTCNSANHIDVLAVRNYGSMTKAHTKKAHTKIPHRKNLCHKCSHEKYPHGKLPTRIIAHTEKCSHGKMLTRKNAHTDEFSHRKVRT
jgi:hypothetical protein